MIWFHALLLRLKVKTNGWPKKRWILGHRGARSIAPENTLSSFRQALLFGADGVEFDVCLSLDGVPVVVHDEKVDRTTDRKGLVRDFLASELSQLDATKNVPNFTKEGIPTLEDTLKSLPDRVIANVELKSSGHFKKPDFILKVCQVLSRHKHRLTIIVSSFDGELLSLVRRHAPEYLIGFLLSSRDRHFPSSLRFVNEVAPEAFHLPPLMVYPLLIKILHKKNVKIAIWNVNKPKAAKKWFKKGIDGIFTDDVEKIVSALKYAKNL